MAVEVTGSLPKQAREVLLSQLPHRFSAASCLSGQKRSLRDANLALPMPLKDIQHVRQIANCYIRLLLQRLCLVVLLKHNGLRSKCDCSLKKNVTGHPERLKEKHSLSLHGYLYSVSEKVISVVQPRLSIRMCHGALLFYV